MKFLRLISQNLKPTSQNPNSQFLRSFLQSRNYTDPAAVQSPPSPPPPTQKITEIADEISNLTLLEVADLTTLLGKKLEVKDMPLVSLMMPGMGFSLRGMGGGGGLGGAAAGVKEEEKKEAKTAFDLKLEAGFDAKAKLKVIKEVRSLTGLGLVEAKQLVEKAPAVFKTAVSKEEAEVIIEKLKAVGAKVTME